MDPKDIFIASGLKTKCKSTIGKWYYAYFLVISAISGLSSCGDIKHPDFAFDTEFPKNNINLQRAIGDELKVNRTYDTLLLKVVSGKFSNKLINEKDGSVFFEGKVCRFRGAYYFNEKINDSSCRIFPVKIKGKLIYGLNFFSNEIGHWYRMIYSGAATGMISYINTDSSSVRIKGGDKRMVKRFFDGFFDELLPDTLLIENNPVVANTDASEPDETDFEEYELMANVYPNPATGIVNISLQKRTNAAYTITDLFGKVMTNGKFTSKENTLNVTDLSPGVYVLNIDANGTRESIRLIKK